jgi:hypothetical protein
LLARAARRRKGVARPPTIAPPISPVDMPCPPHWALSSSVAVLPPITTDDGEATEDGDEVDDDDEPLRPFRRSFRRLLPVVDDVLFMDTLV